ncbi:AFH_G0032320.mRNA.1.CDS.1 [Saccharomyces cerevisiae]|uniref:Putative uncharacterized protein YKL162C-A n=1 Tax=Saccharomyces cerevisiae (strain ATCC 204508 / S288c) TaxID=559292 RepID=YK162_YEAST|nr:RecName: Full=Putative uncharacterized protein YKL162C-A [Saccharomyces cerevisiae S288C]pir/S78726/ protein YKL162c-a - yeast (Saccharomyces cerevisiae) [Saccharomyces cerevisiae]WNV94144.1 hypothetical protein RM700_061 [Saccharomyces cerevisiae synthetic construct]CAI4571444.1 ADQ_G0031650.mRNA.1.CDS.1 [Saccharomyces cerevisiae]CAI4574137.1 AVI_1a_G0031580.mRNA.1.CDS.1 [Saccharomyces cerevisiae]CAI4575910.1 CLN_G0032030.mRNA.1.CDS.1 [Saccharomyces cerevisiae]CAI4581036.1 ALH_1c_G0031940
MTLHHKLVLSMLLGLSITPEGDLPLSGQDIFYQYSFSSFYNIHDERIREQ